MARKVQFHSVTSEGRDKGKRFVITEMPALKAERWAMRALIAMAKSGVQMPEDAIGGGMAVIAMAGFQALQAGIQFEDIAPLMDEMMDCVQIMPDPKNPEVIRPLLLSGIEGDDVEEILTLLEIRERVFAIHTDFFFSGRK